MKAPHQTANHELLNEQEMFMLYQRHNRAYNKSDARKIKRSLHRLAISE